jgi:glycine/D-amino acid oxidase-like deaminating enzyme
VNGVSIAYALAARGVNAVLVEKGALASGASGRSSALVRMHYTNEWDARLAWASFPVFRNWTELMGGPGVFTRSGFVNVVAPEFAERLHRNVEMLKGLGVNTTAITAAELLELQPFANVDDIGAAAYEPESGYANPAETVEGFRRRATELGARVLQWTEVTRVVRRESRVTGIETSVGRIDAGADLHARPKAIDTVAVTRPPELGTGHMVFIDNVQGNYFRPESGGLTLVGVPCQEWDIDPDTMQTGLPPTAADVGARLITHRIPVMERATLSRGYRAFDGYSADRHAILGRVDGIDGLYLATAFSGSGFKIAPAVGACMAELVTEGRAKTVDIEPFSIKRFAEGRTLEGPHPYAVRPDYIDPKSTPAA